MLTTDGEKRWRDRDDEFTERRYGREEVGGVQGERSYLLLAADSRKPYFLLAPDLG